MVKCLVIEDSPVIRDVVVNMFEPLDIDVYAADTVTNGVALLVEHRPDGVLLDWDLPSLGALDFLRGVGDLDPEDRPVVILMATENDHQQFSLAKGAGAGFHILKPFDGAELQAKLVEAGLLAAQAGPKGDDATTENAAAVS